MFYHIKDLQYNARVSKPDPAFATLLLEQFGGANGELAAALRYFVQAFGAKKPHPDKYDMLMDIAIEEFSHLEIVGATIQMLLTGINGDLKNAAENADIMQLLDGKAAKENMIHQGMIANQFLVDTGGGPAYTNCQGVPWTASYINGDAQGELTSGLRSDMAAETRAKMMYEYLLQYTPDPYIKETLTFLMTREIAHYQVFEAALESIKPNFPMGTLHGDPKYSNLYFNMSNGSNTRGPWNQGETTQDKETWQYIEDPIKHVMETNALLDQKAKGTNRTEEQVEKMNAKVGKAKKKEVDSASPTKEMHWNKPSNVSDKTKGSNRQDANNAKHSETGGHKKATK
ncbi:MAG TPA: manganese catalase family protein [Hanamia sp.]|nr:manganese catalase family protein [Hanamia sp.]